MDMLQSRLGADRKLHRRWHPLGRRRIDGESALFTISLSMGRLLGRSLTAADRCWLHLNEPGWFDGEHEHFSCRLGKAGALFRSIR
ncbi:hypothetical protein MRB53_022460 [Persea americana]|uniref:Uncharacterized protein n=1 Tax=Persea americana TaxID=3435 RepID=A0ACC2L714_PERAE|nr:hypothetical protein MRB53_022460 [Persea americana]